MKKTLFYISVFIMTLFTFFSCHHSASVNCPIEPEKPTWTISYNKNGATGGTVPSNQTKAQNVPLSLASNVGNLSKDNFTFSGWNTASDGSGVSYAENSIYTNNAATILYARWKTWKVLDQSSISTSGASYPDIHIMNGLPYVAFGNTSNGGKLTVKKLENSSWTTVGAESLSLGEASSISLKSYGTTLYVAFIDKGASVKVCLKSFDGQEWTSFASTNITSAESISLSVLDGIPYVAYADSNYNVAVVRYENSKWETVGDLTSVKAFSMSVAGIGIKFVASSQGLYLAYNDITNGPTSLKQSAMFYNGRDWVSLGSITPSTASLYIGLNVNNGMPYITYYDATDNANKKLVVKRYNGSSWEVVGNSVGDSFSSSIPMFYSIHFAGEVPYISFVERFDDASEKITVKKYDGHEWVNVGSPQFAQGYFLTLGLRDETPYVAFLETTGQKPVAMMFD